MGKLANALFWRPVARGLQRAGILGRVPSTLEVLRDLRSTSGGFKVGTPDRLTQSWTSIPQPIDAVLRAGLRTMRARAREQSLNNDYDNKFDMMVRSNVVGPNGIRLQMKLKNQDGPLDTLANSAIERAFAVWSRPENCDVTGRESFVSIQNSMISTTRRDGESLARAYRGPGAGRFGYQLQIIDPELLDGQMFEDLPTGERIRFGIAFDKRGRPSTYYLLDDSTIASTGYAYGYSFRGNVTHVEVSARAMRHLFVPKHVGQKRGIPWASTALFRMKMLEGYEEAAIVAARVGAAKMGFFKTDDGRGFPSAEKTATGAKLIRAEPGGFDDLPPNTTLESWDPQYPHEQFDAFVRSQLRGIAAGLGVSYAMLANDLADVNFSSIRTAIQEDRDIWKGLQTFLSDQFIRPTFEDWLFEAILAGAIVDASGGVFSMARYEEAIAAATFVPRGWGWVDPLKEAKAATESIMNGTGTRSEFIRDKGRDPVEVFEESADEKRIRTEHGLTEMPSEPTTSTIAQIEDDEEGRS